MASLEISRVDAVSGPANGMPFLLMKSLPPGMVKETDVDVDELLEDEAAPAAEAEPDPADPMEALEPEEPEAPVEPAVVVPGDPVWEARDAMRGSAIAATLARARSMLCDAHDSEVAEIATGAESDSSSAWELDDALSCLDSALAIVGRFAALEAQEAAEGMEEVAEGEAVVTKAGARLSAASLEHARQARDHLIALIGEDAAQTSEPEDGAAGAPDQEDEDVDVAKAKAMIDESIEGLRADLPELIAKAVADAAAAPKDEAADPAAHDGDEVAKAADEPGTGEAAPDAAGAPITADVLKSTFEEVVKGALAPLEGRLAAIEAQPAPGGPMLGMGGDPDVRGILGGAQTPEQVTKALEAITDPQERAQVATQLGAATLAELYRKG